MTPNLALIVVGVGACRRRRLPVLERSLTRILIGLVMLGNGVNVLFLISGGRAGTAPIVGTTSPAGDERPAAAGDGAHRDRHQPRRPPRSCSPWPTAAGSSPATTTSRTTSRTGAIRRLAAARRGLRQPRPRPAGDAEDEPDDAWRRRAHEPVNVARPAAGDPAAARRRTALMPSRRPGRPADGQHRVLAAVVRRRRPARPRPTSTARRSPWIGRLDAPLGIMPGGRPAVGAHAAGLGGGDPRACWSTRRPGHDRRRARGTASAVYHPTFLVLGAGVSNAFLAGDLFNLFVSFEMLLFASYVLLTLGGTATRIRAGHDLRRREHAVLDAVPGLDRGGLRRDRQPQPGAARRPHRDLPDAGER